MKDKSVSVLATVSVGGSKTLIGAPVSPRCTSAGCHTKMEGMPARCVCMFQEAHRRLSSRPLYRAHLVVSFPSYYTRRFIYILRRKDASCLLGVCGARCAWTRAWLLPLSLFHIGFILVLLTSHFHPSGFSPADRIQLSDVPHGSSQTFALRVSPTWGAATLRWHELVPIAAAAARPTRPRKFLPFSEHLTRRRAPQT